MFVAVRERWMDFLDGLSTGGVQLSLVSCLWDRFDECFLRAVGTQGRTQWWIGGGAAGQAGQVWPQTGESVSEDSVISIRVGMTDCQAVHGTAACRCTEEMRSGK